MDTNFLAKARHLWEELQPKILKFSEIQAKTSSVLQKIIDKHEIELSMVEGIVIIVYSLFDIGIVDKQSVPALITICTHSDNKSL